MSEQPSPDVRLIAFVPGVWLLASRRLRFGWRWLSADRGSRLLVLHCGWLWLVVETRRGSLRPTPSLPWTYEVPVVLDLMPQFAEIQMQSRTLAFEMVPSTLSPALEQFLDAVFPTLEPTP